MTTTMTYAERLAAEKVLLAAMTPEQKSLNAYSHSIGNVDGCARCIDCEIASWNSWKSLCTRR